MRLQNKTTVSILLIVIAFVLIISSEQILLVLPRFESINIEKATNTVDEGLRVMEDEIDNIAITVSDYAVWDDTYNYTKNRDEAFIQANFTDEAMDNLNMSFAGVYGKDGFLFFYDTFEDSQQTETIKNEIGSRFKPELSSGEGFISVGEKTYMFATKQISNTAANQIAGYYFIFGRDYLQATNEKLAKIPGASLEIMELQSLSAVDKQHIEDVYTDYYGNGAIAATGDQSFYEQPDNATILAYA